MDTSYLLQLDGKTLLPKTQITCVFEHGEAKVGSQLEGSPN